MNLSDNARTSRAARKEISPGRSKTLDKVSNGTRMLAHIDMRSAAGRAFGKLMATGWFVSDDSGGPDQFVHASALQRYALDPEQINIGTRLSFQVDNTKPGRYAAVDLKLA